MGSLVDELIAVRSGLADMVDETSRGHRLHVSSDETLLDAIARAGDVVRLVEALLVEAIGEIAERSRSVERSERLTSRMGCHNINELVQRLTRCGPQTAARLDKAAKATAPAWDPISGEGMPAPLPAMREALLDGDTGVDGILAVAGPLFAMRDRADRDEVLRADQVLADQARGEGPDGAPPACADLLRIQAQVWACVLDPDGAEPTERDTTHRRCLTLGRASDGVIPIRGTLLPEVAAQLQRISDAIHSPYVDRVVRFTEDPDDDSIRLLDDRTRPQKLHDALATALTVAAASGELPTIGGAAPTLLVTARAEDVASGAGWAFLEGCDEPVSIQAAVHVACAGVMQRLVHDDTGRIVRLGTEERTFNHHQRRAITARDGGCVIPGCGVPAGWCEIHHVTDHARGGPTHTDNGLLLCWFHHRFVGTGPWCIRMNHGTPEVQAPTWYDRTGRWRPATRSRVRMLRSIKRRT